MAGQLKLRRGTTSQLANFIGSEGELTYDTALKSLVLHDGVTLGGVKMPYLSNDLVPSTMLPTATESVIGASKIATTAIARAGVNDTDLLTAKKLRDALNAEGGAPISACRAWVNFDGINNNIRAGGNVRSVTDNGTGDYTINLTTPLQDQNYSTVATISQSSGNTDLFVCSIISINNSSVRISCRQGNKDFNANVDSNMLSVAIFR